MRLLHVISGLGMGGAETFLAKLAPRLAKMGFDQHVVSVSEEHHLAYRLEAAGIPISFLKVRHTASAGIGVVRLARLMNRLAPDVIQGWMYHGDLFSTLARPLSRARNARLYWGIRCSDMDLGQYSRQLRYTIKACRSLSGVPDAVIANSWKGRSVHEAIGYRPSAWHVIPNGVDGTDFAPNAETGAAVRLELGINPEELVLVHVARVDPMKDHATLLAAMNGVPNVRLIMIGLGTEALSEPPRVLGLGRRQDVQRILCAGDVIVSSSAYGEGFPNALAEGIAAGLFPVSTDVGDASKLVEDTGLLVRPRDPEALANAIRRVRDFSPEARVAAALSAREQILETFSINASVGRFAAIYRGEV